MSQKIYNREHLLAIRAYQIEHGTQEQRHVPLEEALKQVDADDYR